MGKKAKAVECTSKVDEVLSPEVSKKKTTKAKKNVALTQFLADVLPTLKKEMTKKKKESFDFESNAHYFAPDSGYLATYILPLFHFLGKTTVHCHRYGQFDNRHMVKSTAGFDRVMYMCKHANPEEFPSDVQNYCATRFGKEWFKIPSKDGFRAKAAAASGHNGEFIITLTGVFTDSFKDKEGKTVQTINPTLSFEPARAPIPKDIVRVRKARKPQPEHDPNDTNRIGVDCGQPEPDEPALLEDKEEVEDSE